MKRALALLAVPVLCAALAACSSDDKVGRSEKQTAEKYIAALNARDPQGLIDLDQQTPGKTGVKEHADKLITESGGRGIKISDINVIKEFEPTLASVTITGTDGTGKPFDTVILMNKKDGDWFIGLGALPVKGTPKPTAGF
ncbi:hypothetical protein OHA37_40710 (plasmid) [Streptomyces sp. NBC_00335]|uniref:hypothetical protein n=1 Tax=unclassified Streptomyces TaxID=2593676 RepID=UPI00225A61E4|nr:MULTISPECIES: hypothetical protein [unclassified Streptomyces]MCX5410150.1 hypothetical protein [Streptomyces sp. NBC_00086]